MKRLTIKKEYRTNIRYYKSKDVLVGDLTFKLGKLEDIEEKLGVDLITLYKALKQQKVYVIIEDIIIESSSIHMVFRNNEYQLEIDGCHYLNIRDYGETWALTKEELECQK